MYRYTTIILLAFLFSCSSPDIIDSWPVRAEIIGQDMRECACCSGWLIKIDTNYYNFEKLPANANFNLDSEKYPLPVQILYKKRTTGCKNMIDITNILKYQAEK